LRSDKNLRIVQLNALETLWVNTLGILHF
jgi:hypothetical protein